MHLAAAVLALSTTGCMAFHVSQHRDGTPRREAKDIAKLAVIELAIGSALGVASYYWFEHTDRTMQGESSAHNPRLLALLGILSGAGFAGSGLVDAGIAGTQAVTNSFVMSSEP